MQYLTWFAGLAIVWVIFQYVFIGSSRSIPIIKDIKIHIDEFKSNHVVIVQHQQVPFVLVHRSKEQIKKLKNQHLGTKPLRSVMDEYFIALAIGTNYGCIVTAYNQEQLKESCSTATYDYSGRSILGDNEALKVPEMTYNKHTQFFNITMK